MRTIITLSMALFFGGMQLTSYGQQAGNSMAKMTVETGKNLFESDSVLDLVLSGDIRKLLDDRSDKPDAHRVNVRYTSADGSIVELGAEAKTRGHFRKQQGVCTYPPLSLQFTSSETFTNSIFQNQQKIKLVMPCQGDEYVVREWLVYKIYNLISAKSFKARLVRLTLEEQKSKKTGSGFYGILLEEENQLATRNNAIAVTRKLSPNEVDVPSYLNMTMFQYLIGNTDWSVQYLQNIKLLAKDYLAIPIAVPYDFDHAGIVNTPYAFPAEELLMSSVKERRYRGYCIKDMAVFAPSIAFFNQIKPAVYKLYTPNNLLDEKYIKSTVKYLDEFYATINNPENFKKEFSYPCDPNGTGDVIIKGLKVD